VLSALVIIDDDRIEQVGITPAQILGSDKLEGDSKRHQVGRVGRELGVGEEDVEAEATTARGAGSFMLRSG